MPRVARWKLNRLNPAQIVLIGFFLLIMTGTGLLMLPISSRSGVVTPFADALFTATSATCVTGLIVFDTYTYWTFFGQLVILIMIQIGGLGVVTMAVAGAAIAGKKIGLKQRVVMQESISAPQMSGIVRLTNFIIRATAFLEGAGACILAIRFIPMYGVARGIWFSVFHSISAFCNAGFDLMGEDAPMSSLTSFSDDALVIVPIMLLITIGGLGFFTWHDILENKWRVHHYRLQTKLVLLTSALLIVIPSLYFFFYEFAQPQWSYMTFSERVLSSLFTVVTPRTAGFNSVDFTMLHSSGALLITCLMIIGGSPGSTAGGVKTTLLAVVLLSARATLQRRDSLHAFGRRIPPEILRSAVTLFTLYGSLLLTGTMLISCIDGVSAGAVVFECASAIGTVGLTLNLTPTLSTASHIILTLLMYFGRMGGLTVLYAVTSGRYRSMAQLPQEKITVG